MLRTHLLVSGLVLTSAAAAWGAPPTQPSQQQPGLSQARRQVNPAVPQTRPQAPSATGGLADQKQKISYSLGLDVGRTLKMQQIQVDPQLILRGIQDGLSSAKPLLSDAEIREVMEALQQEMLAREMERSKTIGAQNLEEGERFLAENKKQQGVVTLPSGLQYKVLKAGNGKRPKATDTVTTHYKGTLLDGTEFDSSYKRGEPTTFQLNQVIPGWTEALQLMPVGSKWELYVPAKLAYGERGAGGDIGPNATLIFQVELLGIEEQK
jgi:FKBP-type peptidyl-prolyl cis-trans isomerase